MNGYRVLLGKVDAVLEARRMDKMGVVLPSESDKMQSYVDEARSFTYFSFTALDKLGINPQSVYDTPIGIYSYPFSDPWTKAAWKNTSTTKTGNRQGIPFADKQPFIQIFKAKRPARVIVVNDLCEIVHGRSVHESALMSLREMYSEEEIDRLMRRSNASTPMSLLWDVTRMLVKGSGSEHVKWAKLLRDLDIEGIEDHGSGMIHENEPHQAVFFSKDYIEHIETINNPLKGAAREVDVAYQERRWPVVMRELAASCREILDDISKAHPNGFNADQFYESLNRISHNGKDDVIYVGKFNKNKAARAILAALINIRNALVKGTMLSRMLKDGAMTVNLDIDSQYVISFISSGNSPILMYSSKLNVTIKNTIIGYNDNAHSSKSDGSLVSGIKEITMVDCQLDLSQRSSFFAIDVDSIVLKRCRVVTNDVPDNYWSMRGYIADQMEELMGLKVGSLMFGDGKDASILYKSHEPSGSGIKLSGDM